MKKRISRLLILVFILNIFAVYNTVSAATMRYTDNIKTELFPERLKKSLSNHPWEDGFLDVTKPPYSAKGDGVNDDTKALQDAIDDAYASNLIVYLPQGNYLVSKQLVLNQYPSSYFHKDLGIKFQSQRKFGNILVGSTEGGKRPKITLKDNSKVDQNILLLYRYFDPKQKDIDKDRGKHYLATFRGIDIDMGNNPTVSAISMNGAQYCTIQDVNIYGKDFYAGVHKIPGAVGSILNLKVSGGKIGILSDSYVPEPLISGVVLENQKEYGIKIVDSRNSPVNLVGFKIISPDSPSKDYRAVYADERGVVEDRGAQRRAHVTLTDGTIEVKGDNGKAIESYNQYVVMKNVFVKASTIIDAGIKNSPTENVAGDKNSWKKVENYAFAPADNKGFIHIDGVEKGNSDKDVQYFDNIKNEEPKEDLIKKHTWPIQMPSYDDKNKVNIVKDYGATPYNHEDDDSIAIQKAIDDTTTAGSPNFGKEVFIPRGHFQTKNPIILKKGTKIFGAGKNISVIHQNVNFDMSKGPAIVDTVDDKDGNIVLADFAILRQDSSQSKGTDKFKNLSILRIRSNNTVMRDVQIAGIEEKQDNFYVKPEVIFSDNVGGKIYNLAVNTSVKASSGGNIHSDYRRVFFQNTTNPLQVYQCGVNNTEKTYVIELSKANNVSIYGIKFEEQNQLMKITDSSNISVLGGSGYYTVVDNIDSIISISNSKNIYFAGIGRTPMQKYVERDNKHWLINGKDSILDDNDIILYINNEAQPTAKFEEVLQNSNFEKGMENWKSEGNAKISEEGAKVFEGTKSLKVSKVKSKDDVVVQDITAALQKQGTGSYMVSGYIMNDSVYDPATDALADAEEDSDGTQKAEKDKSNKTDKTAEATPTPAVDKALEAEVKQNAAKEALKNVPKASITLEVKHDGKTERYNFDDYAFNYWNRVSGSVDLSWDKLESAKIIIDNSSSKTDYFIDQMTIQKEVKGQATNKNDKSDKKGKGDTNLLVGIVVGALILSAGVGLFAYKKYKK